VAARRLNSRQKGVVGEREAAKFATKHWGIPCRRGRQFQGSPESPDIVGFDGFHVEVKRTERLSLYSAMDQSEADAGESVPGVLHRRNHKPWLLVLRAVDFPRLVRAYLEAGGTCP